MTNNRSYVLGVRLTEPEKVFLHSVATAKGLSPSSILRTAAMSKLLLDALHTDTLPKAPEVRL